MSLNPFSKIIFFSALIFLNQMHVSNADIETVSLKNESRPSFHLNEFGFSSNGYISVDISDVSITNTTSLSKSTLNLSRIGVVAVPWFYEYFDEDCFLGYGASQTVLTFHELPSNPPSPFKKTIHVNTTIEDLGSTPKWEITFVNCNNHTSVTAQIKIATYNLVSSGKKSYLSTWKVPLIGLNFGFSFCHAIFLVLWIHCCLKQISSVHTVHILMGTLLFFKSLDLFFQGEELWHVNAVGEPSHLLGTFLDLSELLRGMLFVSVFMLIGAGWQILRPCLQLKEKVILGTGLAIQFIVNVGFMELKARSPYLFDASCYGWALLFMVLDIVSIAIRLLPIRWQIVFLRDSGGVDGRAATNLEKLKVFSSLYYGLLTYLEMTKYIPLGIVYLVNEDENERAALLIAEISALIFYSATFYCFRPNPRSQYLAVNVTEEEEAVALQEIQRDFNQF